MLSATVTNIGTHSVILGVGADIFRKDSLFMFKINSMESFPRR
jgi:hypothetical protein